MENCKIEVTGLRKSFGSLVVLRDINLKLDRLIEREVKKQ